MKENNILINKWENSQIIDKVFSKTLNKTIVLESDSHLKYLIISSLSEINLDFSSLAHWCTIEVYAIFLSKNKEELLWNISVNLQNNDCNADVYMLSLMGNDSLIKVKWNIDIHPWITGVKWYLLEENIILWEKIQIKTLPILNVSSNDVSAWHGARIHKLDSEKLFYMMSKWLSNAKSKEIIINWYVNFILEKFTLLPEDKIEIETLILNYLLNLW